MPVHTKPVGSILFRNLRQGGDPCGGVAPRGAVCLSPLSRMLNLVARQHAVKRAPVDV